MLPKRSLALCLSSPSVWRGEIPLAHAGIIASFMAWSTGCELDWSKEQQSEDDGSVSFDSGASADGSVKEMTTTEGDAGLADAGGNGAADGGNGAADGGGEGAPDNGSGQACPSIINACGGCGALSSEGPLDKTCGTCGTYVCSSDKLHVVCDDPGETNACPTWCTGQVVPEGVLASDFQCVDFDRGMPDAKVWKQTVSGNGVLERTDDAFASGPYSLAASVVNFSGVSTLGWTAVGATPVKTVTVSAAIKPEYGVPLNILDPIWVDLLCIETGSNNTCLSYVRNVDDPLGQPFSGGLAVYSTYGGGFLVRGGCALTTSFFNDRVWNDAALKVDVDTGDVTFTLNGAVASPESCGGYFTPDTNAEVRLGADSSDWRWTQNVDNITVAVTR